MAADTKDKTHWREWIDPEDIRGAVVAGLIAGLIAGLLVLDVDITLHESVIEPKTPHRTCKSSNNQHTLPCHTQLAAGVAATKR